MSAVSLTFGQGKLLVSYSVTSSLALECGATLYAVPGGGIIDQYGQEVARASLSARQVKALGLLMSGTSGRTGSTSSESAALQSFLESRLRARLPIAGPISYKTTWKPWVTPSGRSRFRLRASGLRTSETGSTGWPTTRALDGDKNVRTLEGCLAEIARKGCPQDLNQAAAAASWRTPNCPRRNDNDETAGRSYSSKLQMDLADQAVRLVGGETLLTSGASTRSIGQLNPAHSRWLMGLPPVWDDCAVTAMQSLAKPRKSSSKRAD
jgi:hypothetical protein